MAIFSSLDDFKEPKPYVTLLKKALLVVKPGVEKKFLYFKQFPFGAKKLQLVLVDFDSNCVSALAKAGHKPTAEGIVTLTEKEELNFDAKKGSLKRVKIKKYFGTLGPGIKEVFVPPGEVDEEEEGTVSAEGQDQVPSSQPAPPPPGQLTQPAPAPPMGKQMERKLEFEENQFKRRQLTTRLEELQKKSVAPTGEASKADTLRKAKALGDENKFAEANLLLDQFGNAASAMPELPPLGKQMEKKLEFEENQFKLRQLLARIEEVRKKPFPPLLERLKTQTLEKAKSLGQENKFPEANQLLDLLVAKATAAQTQPAPAPKLSAYMNATRDWRAAKKTAGDGVFALKNAILKECDKELEKAVKAKIDQLNGILTVMDDGIITKIEDAGREADAERQVERNQALAKFANTVLAAVSNHPLANVADNNPFGTFTIRGPVETVLTKFIADFGG